MVHHLQVIADYVLTVKEEIAKCSDEACKMMYLRSIGNSGIPSLLPTLLKVAEESKGAALSLTAVQSLRRYPEQLIYEQVKHCTHCPSAFLKLGQCANFMSPVLSKVTSREHCV